VLNIYLQAKTRLLWFMKLGFAQLHWQASTLTGIHYIFREQE